jgi:hypothetical protein
MGALTFLILAGILSFMTGRPRDDGDEKHASPAPPPRVVPLHLVRDDSGAWRSESSPPLSW